ncbi:hypothetical protein HGRIS_007848 [Hohenbuehelia grisea]|uniref:Uncharacterized protein n=1 Tax=Hohenbuehelia grisea TaxID=104357 RepID=A0ABR3J6I7_9AGAR
MAMRELNPLVCATYNRTTLTNSGQRCCAPYNSGEIIVPDVEHAGYLAGSASFEILVSHESGLTLANSDSNKVLPGKVSEGADHYARDLAPISTSGSSSSHVEGDTSPFELVHSEPAHSQASGKEPFSMSTSSSVGITRPSHRVIADTGLHNLGNSVNLPSASLYAKQRNRTHEAARIYPSSSLDSGSTIISSSSPTRLSGTPAAFPEAAHTFSLKPARPSLPRIFVPGSNLTATQRSPSSSRCVSTSPATPTSISFSSITSDPPSPIVFASPTSSHMAYPFLVEAKGSLEDGNSFSSLDGSQSPQTSYGSWSSDQGAAYLPTLGNHYQGVSGSLSALTRSYSYPGKSSTDGATQGSHGHFDNEASLALATFEDQFPPTYTRSCLPDVVPGVEGLNLEVESSAMPNTNPSTMPIPQSPSDQPWTLSLSPSPDDYFGSNPLSPASANSLSLSLSPASSYGAPLGSNSAATDGHIISFSHGVSPASSYPPSPSLPAPLPLTEENVLGLITEERRESTAAEYVAALTSHAWEIQEEEGLERTFLGLDGPPQGLFLARYDSHDTPHHAQTEESAVPSSIRPSILDGIEFHQPVRKQGVLNKVKSYGIKVKRMLSPRKAGRHRTPSVSHDLNAHLRAAQLENAPSRAPRGSVIDDILHDAGGDGPESDGLPRPLPPPPGLYTRARKPRPSITAQTYATLRNSLPLARTTSPPAALPPPLIRVRSPSPSRRTRIIQASSPRRAPSSRRLTLAAFSSLMRLSPSSTMSEDIVLPSSADACGPSGGTSPDSVSRRFSYAGRGAADVGVIVETNLLAPPPRVRARGREPPPTTLIPPAADASSPPAPTSISTPSSPVTPFSAARPAKKNRRFSLSALTTFSVGRQVPFMP